MQHYFRSVPPAVGLHRRACHSSAVISQISAGNRPETKSRSSVATMRIPCLAEIRHDALFRVGEFERTQPQPLCFKYGYHGDNLIAHFAHKGVTQL